MAVTATSSNVGTGTISSPGIGSNLDVNSIVNGLMQAERLPVTNLQTQEASYQAKLTAYGTLKGAVAQFQSAVQGLSNPAQFNALTAIPSDASVLSATAGSSAVAGSYAIDVDKQAQAQSLIAAGQASTTATIGSGVSTTLTFQFGTVSGGTLTNGQYSGATFTADASQTPKTVTIDSSTNSLAGIRDAINAANIGVVATIVNDGSASPNRLVLTSTATGATKSMQISVSGDAALASLLAEDPAGTQNLTQTSAAQNAALTINGIAITSATNTVSGAIQGVNLTIADSGSTNLSIAPSTAATQAGVQAFVKAYNDLNSELDSLSAYDASSKQAGLLQGDFSVRSIQTQVRQTLTSTLAGATGAFTLLSQIGVSFQKDGSLSIDSTKLSSAMTSNFGDIVSLFSAIGKASDSLVGYAGAGAKTQPGTYALSVTQLATRSSVTGSAAAALTINTGINDKLNITVDGVGGIVTLAAGTYTADALAAQVQAAINGTTAFSSAGIAVTASQSAGVISIASNRYGSASSVNVTGGNGATDLLGATPTTATGVDVAGLLNGIPATGVGQVLTGATGSATEGLRVQINGGAIGSRGTVSYSQGYAARLNTLANSFLDVNGLIASNTDGINSTIKDIDNQVADWNSRLADIEANYRKQFTALDTLVSNMNATSSFLTQQLANLPAIANTTQSK